MYDLKPPADALTPTAAQGYRAEEEEEEEQINYDMIHLRKDIDEVFGVPIIKNCYFDQIQAGYSYPTVQTLYLATNLDTEKKILDSF